MDDGCGTGRTRNEIFPEKFALPGNRRERSSKVRLNGDFC
jgi:hypothetical protein